MPSRERSDSHLSVGREEPPQGFATLVGELIDELEQAYKDLLFEADRDERLLKGITKRDESIEALKQENTRLKREVVNLKADLEKVKSAKGYRLQRKFWRLRKAIAER
ncbi:hypothetical protein CAFEA_08125 [Corynebacterium afermentans subsp. afermentans]|uniref:Uncharacterized protein n=1 Tax=Corynebacterium afermentans TaxID=38286 RepID=A0A9X8R607_9CORY|nr:hypothetical protein [Corynebacterium afermentans]OAA16640.1 hypothetical protein Caferm_03735 [Corynebacterium afermentans subsp. afermentans]WJY57210.1 hypothetical protein CAFEA_08125 [Corynebacterium afermentans subsp. afermentans]SIQ57904.1 hypothetical protein SAMN05421802_11936 [Corynebacterium afermentans]